MMTALHVYLAGAAIWMLIARRFLRRDDDAGYVIWVGLIWPVPTAWALFVIAFVLAAQLFGGRRARP